MDHAAAVAAAAFAINLQDVSEQKSETLEASLTKTKSKVDCECSSSYRSSVVHVSGVMITTPFPWKLFLEPILTTLFLLSWKCHPSFLTNWLIDFKTKSDRKSSFIHVFQSLVKWNIHYFFYLYSLVPCFCYRFTEYHKFSAPCFFLLPRVILLTQHAHHRFV